MSTIGRNTIWNLLGQAAPALVAVFTIPIVIRGIGTERFGVLALIWFVVGYFSIFDMGLGRALTQLLAQRLGQEDQSAVPGLVWTALALMGILGIAATAVAALVAPLVAPALKAPSWLRVETLDAVYILALSIPLVVSTAGLRGVLEARQRFDLANIVRLGSGVFTYLAPLITLAFSRSLVAITLLLVAGRFVAWLAYLIMSMRELPELRRGVRFDRSFVRPLMRFGGWMTVSNLLNPFLVYADRFLIATVLGATAVAYYVTPFEIIVRLLFLPWAFSGVLFPLLASVLSHDRDRGTRLYDRGMWLTFLVLFPFVLCAIAFAHEGLALWVGESIAIHSAPVLRWLALGVFMNGIVQVPFSTIQAVGRPDLTARIYLIEIPLYLPTLWWMTHRWGIEGAAIAWSLRGGLDLLIQCVVARRLLPAPAPGTRINPSEQRATAVVASGFALFGFAAVALASNLAARTIIVVVILAAFGVLGWTRMLDPQERAYARQFVHRAKARFRTA